MGNSKMVIHTHISPNKNVPRNARIDKITIHHMAGNLSVETCGNVFAPSSRKASSNYGIDSKGRVGMYVEEKDRSWCSSNAANDHRAVTIEVADDTNKAPWHSSREAMTSLVLLCVDICRRNGISALNYTGDKNGNLTLHKWFTSTSCPGEYLETQMPRIASEVNKLLKSGGISFEWSDDSTVIAPSKPVASPTTSNTTVTGGNIEVNTRTLKKGMSGADVKSLQILLNAKAGAKLVADGIFGSATFGSVTSYQRSKGLVADGIVGSLTWNSLINK